MQKTKYVCEKFASCYVESSEAGRFIRTYTLARRGTSKYLSQWWWDNTCSNIQSEISTNFMNRDYPCSLTKNYALWKLKKTWKLPLHYTPSVLSCRSIWRMKSFSQMRTFESILGMTWVIRKHSIWHVLQQNLTSGPANFRTNQKFKRIDCFHICKYDRIPSVQSVVQSHASCFYWRPNLNIFRVIFMQMSPLESSQTIELLLYLYSQKRPKKSVRGIYPPF